MAKHHTIPFGPVPTWLPDWLDPSAYPAHDSLLLWAWEFLRRNEEYIADYEHFSSLPAYHEHGGKTGKFSGRSIGDELRFYHCEPPALPGEDFDAYCRRNGGWGNMESLESYLMGKWGVLMLPNPAEYPIWMEDWFDGYGEYIDGSPPHYFIFEKEEELLKKDPAWLRGKRRVSLLCGTEVPLSEPNYEDFVRFDIRYPIERQIEAVKSWLIERQNEAENNGSLKKIGAVGSQVRKLPL